MSIDRYFGAYLGEWDSRKDRKPLVIRGMRQTGKTFCVRQFAADRKYDLFEVNLEKHPVLHQVFVKNDIDQILREIEALLQKKVGNNALIFLDEIQMVPAAISVLRYFYEERPELRVIATGSLLDFALEKKRTFAMPVGRVEYAYLYPLNFEEFVRARNEEYLARILAGGPGKPLAATAHARLLELTREYFLVGGMPEVVAGYVEDQDFREAARRQENILTTLQDDFGKYAGGRDLALMQRIFRALPAQVGRKLKYVNLDREEKALTLRNILELFQKARLLHFVRHSDGNGIPLEGEADDRVCKIVFCDIGLFSRLMGVVGWPDQGILGGSWAEQFAGQELAAVSEWEERELYYWLREKKQKNAEVDYLVQQGQEIYPVEVKASREGRLRSLHEFMAAKGRKIAYRLDANLPARQEVEIKLANGQGERRVRYELRSLPLYWAGTLGKNPAGPG